MNKILISAYAISPIRGSECAVGWEICTRLANYFEVTVLMCKETPSGDKYHTEIEEYFKKNGTIQNLKFIPIDMPISSKKYTLLHDWGFWPAYYWSYNCWQKSAYKVVKKLHAQERFELAYQLNMIGFREPGYLWQLDIPFVWGPTNGFHSVPLSFIRELKGKDFIFQTLKHLANEIQIQTSIRTRKAASEAAIVWCVDNTALTYMKKWSKRAELMQETGLWSISENNKKNRYYDGERTLNLVWSGMITTGKALDILIEALIKIKHLNFHLTILGDGPQKNNLITEAIPIRDKLTWLGWIDRKQVLERIDSSDLLIHTSLKEATSVTILEAIGFGVPVACHDTCGMGAVVTDKNGFKIPYINKATSVAYLTNLLTNIITQPDILNNKYITIGETTSSLTWNSKVNEIAKTIKEILA